MPTANEFVSIELTDAMEITARWFAERRILYEYPLHDRQVFGEYSDAHVDTIQRGIIGELAVFSYLHEGLQEQYGNEDVRTRHQSVRDRLSLDIALGRFDPGYDLTVMGRKVDVKAYGTVLVDQECIPRLNLLVNQQQADRHQAADLYVQVFITTNRLVVLAGYHEGLPPLDCTFRSPAYACKVPDLLPMANLRRMVRGNA